MASCVDETPSPCSIVVIRVPDGVSTTSGLAAGDVIERVVAVGGDIVSCCDMRGRVYVNGVGLDEPYLANRRP